MRKFFTLLSIALFAVVTTAFAALNGTYTVGGTTPDYATPAAAAAAVVSQGVSGPVVFNIRPGTYTGNMTMNAIAGASSTNTITFQAENGDSTSVILTYPAGTAATDNWVINIYGADWVTLRQLTLRRDGTGAYGTVVQINNISIGITVENCLIYSTPTTATTTNAVGIYSPTGGTSVDSITTIRNNEIHNGSYGIHLAGPNSTFREARNTVENNRLIDIGNRGIHLQDQRRPKVIGNTIASVPNSTQFIGVYITNTDRAAEVTGNRVAALSTGLAYGLNMISVSSTAGDEGLVANNFFAASSASTGYGILLTGCNYIYFYYNSTNVSGVAATAAGLALLTPVSSNLSLINNIFSSPRLGISTAAGTSAGILTSNYNDIYGAVATGSWDGINAVSLADWQAASSKDVNSVSGDPQYVSFVDLHAASGVVNDNALPLANITTDIDGNLRSATTPDMGAAEFTPLADNMGAVAILQPKSTSCGTDNVQVVMVIRNFGGASQSNIPVTVEVSGAVTATLTENYAGPLAGGASDTITFTQTISTLSGGTVNFMGYTSLAADQDNSNDTLFASASFLALPNPPTTTNFSYCPGTTITSTTDSGYATFWYDSDTATTPIYIGNTLNPNLTADTTYWVETRQEGAGGCLRITEIALDDPVLPLGGSGDFIEIQNLSALSFDATGWKVVACDGSANINTLNAITWDLGVFQPGEIQYRSDNAADNYWGSNLLLNPGQNGWVMIIDANGIVQDYVAFGWLAGDIQGQVVSVAGFNVSPGSQWTGDGGVACTGTSVSRTGSSDHDNASDWTCSAYTPGAQNGGLSTSFTGCGYGPCPSIRIPVQVTVAPAASVTLGPDTAFEQPFSYTLDAGSGFTSYLWSDQSSGQTLTVSTYGTYYVTVTNSSGCTATDSVVITIATGLSSPNAQAIKVYPNPASVSVTVTGLSHVSGSYTARVLDVQGREVFRKEGNASLNDRITIETAGWAEGNYVLQLQGETFYTYRPLMITHN